MLGNRFRHWMSNVVFFSLFLIHEFSCKLKSWVKLNFFGPSTVFEHEVLFRNWIFYDKKVGAQGAEVAVRRCSVKKVFSEISQNSHENTCPWVFFATLLKKRPWHRCFPVNFVKFLRTASFTGHLWWLLLKVLRIISVHVLLLQAATLE